MRRIVDVFQDPKNYTGMDEDAARDKSQAIDRLMRCKPKKDGDDRSIRKIKQYWTKMEAQLKDLNRFVATMKDIFDRRPPRK
jgi:hypothetical protein